MGGTSEARCKPSRSEGEAQELGDDDSCLIEYSESCRTSETGIEAASGEQGLGKASNRGLCTPKGNGSRCSDRHRGRRKMRPTFPATDPGNRNQTPCHNGRR